MVSIIELINQIQEASGIYKEVDTVLLSSIMSSVEEEKKKTRGNYSISQEEIAIIYLHEKFGLPFSICNNLGINDIRPLNFMRKYRKEDIGKAEERLNTFLLNNKDKEFIDIYLQSLEKLRNWALHHPFSYVQITLYNLLMKKRDKNFIFKHHSYGISELTSRRIQNDIKEVLKWT